MTKFKMNKTEGLEKSNNLFMKYENSVMPHGTHSHKTASDKAMKNVCLSTVPTCIYTLEICFTLL